MKILGAKKVILTILVVLATLTFSTLALSFASIIKDNKTKSTTETLEVNASWDGSGTEYNPYLISSISDMNKLSADIKNGTSYYDTYFKLTTDLDYYGEKFIPIGGWEEKGRYKFNAFAGIFDGDGHTISNININLNYNQNDISSGLFAALGGGLNASQYNEEDRWEDFLYPYDNGSYYHTVEVKNLQLYNFNSNVTSSYGGCYAGGICGLVFTGSWEWVGNYGLYDNKTLHGTTKAKISNCIVNKSSISVSDYCWAGGLVGAHMTHDYDSEDANKLFLRDCMVWNSNINAKAYAYLSPALGLLSGANYPHSLFDWTLYDKKLCMNYDIEYCVTNACNQYAYIDNYWNGYWSEDTEFTKVEYYSGKTYNDGVKKLSTKLSDVYGGMDLWRAGTLVDFSSSYWVFIHPDEREGFTIYLKTFTTTAYWDKTPNDSDGTVDLVKWNNKSWGLESAIIPKIPVSEYATSTSTSYVIFSYREYDIDANDNYFYETTNLLVLKATDGTVSKFKKWTVESTDDGITFTAHFEGATFDVYFSVNSNCTLKAVVNNNYPGTTITSYYQVKVKAGTSYTLSYSSYGKSGSYKSCSITMVDVNGKTITMTYTVNNLYCISEFKFDPSESCSSSGTINKTYGNANVYTVGKSYGTQFG